MNDLDIDTKDLLVKLTSICKQGPIKAPSKGSNAVGKLLQEQLGVVHSTTSRNSVCGYTVTATSNSRGNGRTNLFACVPDWKKSEVTSSLEHVTLHGRSALERGYSKALFCTLNSFGPNSFGLYLKANPLKNSLEEWVDKDGQQKCILAWDTEKLFNKLEKLGKTAIVTGLPVDLNGSKAFHFRYVELLEQPDPTVFLRLIEEGSITLDHCISIPKGKSTAREQGPLFKIRSESREELYGMIKRYDLLQF